MVMTTRGVPVSMNGWMAATTAKRAASKPVTAGSSEPTTAA